ncbi:MAG: hypothetical protein A2X28_04145 [Elusimicrobia bacterium GWA2_56_46]|jgi:prepilin-type N-terminal cleavage/methylation domain-containing protein|nr:MAG: hypothetical protein A2X28_04145 [Elusimicrobia bacterium GWA2_56_46]OGR56068.1 MAG: hypothetical protein A2X39_07565 [Elusimicrobia bacterium GWC2_56_31]HBW22901.1 hypothetical protein [Elusimicrobiota bacterium]
MKIAFRKGFTLVEVVVASMVLVMVAVTCASLLLSTFTSFPKEKIRYQAAQEAASLKEELKNYVTEDRSTTAGAPGNPPSWHLPDDSSCANCWALAAGTHTVTNRLPLEMRQTYGATMSYFVKTTLYQGKEMRDVNVSINYTVP